MFKKSIYVLIAALFIGGVTPIQAAEVLIVSVEKVLANSLAGKSLRSQAQKRVNDLNATRDKIQKKLQASVKKLEQQKTLLTSEALRAKADDLRLKEIAKNQELQQLSRKLQTSQAVAQNEIFAKLLPILTEIMKEKKASSIIRAQFALAATPDIDVTDIAVKRLDAVLKSVKIAP